MESVLGNQAANTTLPGDIISTLRTKAYDAYANDDLAQALAFVKQLRLVEGSTTQDKSSLAIILHASILIELQCFPAAQAVLGQMLPPYDTKVELLLAWAWCNFYRQQKQYPKAEEWAQKLIELNPSCTAGYIFLGNSLLRQGQFERAIVVCRQATTLDGDPDEAFLNIGLAYRAQGQFVEAIRAFRDAMRLTPDYTPAQNALRDVQAAIELRTEARSEEMGDAANLKAPRDEVHGIYVDNYKLQVPPSIAGRARIRRAINAREEKRLLQGDVNSRMWWDRALESHVNCDVAQSMVSLERCRSIQLDYGTLVLSGMILTGIWRFEEAHAAFDHAGVLSKGIPQLRRGLLCNERALLHRAQGNFKAEEHSCRQGIEVEPDRAGHYIDLGICLSRQSRFPEAAETFRHAVQLENGEEAFLRLAYVLRSQGDYEASAESAREALRIDPDCDHAAAVLEDVLAAMEIEATPFA
jgi:tetratricopeptide (TPR) repeat protein